MVRGVAGRAPHHSRRLRRDPQFRRGLGSDDARPHHRDQGLMTVVPVTSNVARIYPFQVLLPANATGLDLDSKAQAEQVRSISVDRLGAAIGEVPHALMEELDEALRLHLAL